jgi:hypothetical protein
MTTVVGMGHFDLLKREGEGGEPFVGGVEGVEGARDLGLGGWGRRGGRRPTAGERWSRQSSLVTDGSLCGTILS